MKNRNWRPENQPREAWKCLNASPTNPADLPPKTLRMPCHSLHLIPLSPLSFLVLPLTSFEPVSLFSGPLGKKRLIFPAVLLFFYL